MLKNELIPSQKLTHIYTNIFTPYQITFKEDGAAAFIGHISDMQYPRLKKPTASI